ncbi:glutamate-rich protein 1-like [Aplochiton taeniatus]
METYLSDRLLPADRLPPPPVAVVEGLLSSISSDTAPPSVLKQIHTLRTLVELREPQRLAEALEELHSSSTMPADEAAAVVFLFGYWITDIFPMQEDTVVAQ